VLLWLNLLEKNLVSLAITQTKKHKQQRLRLEAFSPKCEKNTVQLLWWSQLESNYFQAADSFRSWSLLIFTRNFLTFIESETSLQFSHEPMEYLKNLHKNNTFFCYVKHFRSTSAYSLYSLRQDMNPFYLHSLNCASR